MSDQHPEQDRSREDADAQHDVSQVDMSEQAELAEAQEEGDSTGGYGR